MLKSEVGESRRAPAESFLSAGARFPFSPFFAACFLKAAN